MDRTLFPAAGPPSNGAMDMDGMERVWHGSHRKPGGRNWSMYTALAMMILLFSIIASYVP